jgi:hypothetical protein
VRVRRALLSVSDKRGIVDFARDLGVPEPWPARIACKRARSRAIPAARKLRNSRGGFRQK